MRRQACISDMWRRAANIPSLVVLMMTPGHVCLVTGPNNVCVTQCLQHGRTGGKAEPSLLSMPCLVFPKCDNLPEDSIIIIHDLMNKPGWLTLVVTTMTGNGCDDMTYMGGESDYLIAENSNDITASLMCSISQLSSKHIQKQPIVHGVCVVYYDHDLQPSCPPGTGSLWLHNLLHG